MDKAGKALCLAVLVSAAAAMLGGLGQGPLQPFDEGTYAQVTHEMLQSGDYLDFTLGGGAWLEKPPLYFWLAGLATEITHEPVLGIRLPAALFAIAVVAMTMLLAYEASKNYWIAALAGIVLLMTQPFVQGAREARLDMLAAFFILLAYWASFNKRYVWFGIAVALAVLSKSVIGIFAALALPTVSFWLTDWGWIKDRRFWLGAGIGLVIVAPWHMYEWWQYGGEFWRQYIGYHVLARYESNLFGRPDLQTDYWGRLLDFAKPVLGAFLLSLAALPLYADTLDRRAMTRVAACLCLLGIMGLVFFTAQTRALSYLIPLYPFAALFISLSAWHLYEKAVIR